LPPLLTTLFFLGSAVLLAVAVNIASAKVPPQIRFVADHPWTVIGVLLVCLGGLAVARWLADRPEPDPMPLTAWPHVRRELLTRMRHDWIDGVLTPSLPPAADPVAVRFRDRVDLVAPLGGLVRRPAPAARDAVRDVTELADAATGGLLLLGGPGSGKTTQLLLVLDELLRRSAADEIAPIPVVLHLTTWLDQSAPLDEWMATEITTRYGMPAPAARSLIGFRGVIPLLDGLDELGQSRRAACLTAVDRFHRSAAAMPLVLCSRTEEFVTLDQRLGVSTALEALPVLAGDADSWLAAQGRSRAELGEIDADLLSLNLLVRLPPVTEERDRDGLLDAWVTHAASETPRGRTAGVRDLPADRLVDGLSRLAAQMRLRGLSLFDPAWMQVDWLTDRRHAALVMWAPRLILLVPVAVAVAWTEEVNARGANGWLLGASSFLIAAAVAYWFPHRPIAAFGLRGLPGNRWHWPIAALQTFVVLLVAGSWLSHSGLSYSGTTATDLTVLGGALLMPAAILAFLATRPAEYGDSFFLSGRVGLAVVAGVLARMALPVSVVAVWQTLSLALTGRFPHDSDLVAPEIVLVVLSFSLFHGGVRMLVRQAMMRRFLVREGVFPYGTTGLIEPSVAHLMLRRVGPDLAFPHRALRDHLADRAAPPARGAAARQDRRLGIVSWVLGGAGVLLTVHDLALRHWSYAFIAVQMAALGWYAGRQGPQIFRFVPRVRLLSTPQRVDAFLRDTPRSVSPQVVEAATVAARAGVRAIDIDFAGFGAPIVMMAAGYVEEGAADSEKLIREAVAVGIHRAYEDMFRLRISPLSRAVLVYHSAGAPPELQSAVLFAAYTGYWSVRPRKADLIPFHNARAIARFVAESRATGS
jgi:hypothetical protein